MGFTACVNTIQSHITKHQQCHILQNLPKNINSYNYHAVKSITPKSPKRGLVTHVPALHSIIENAT